MKDEEKTQAQLIEELNELRRRAGDSHGVNSERESIEKQFQYYTNLQEYVSDAIIYTDPDFTIKAWNQAAEVMYGWQATEVIGKSVPEVLKTEFLHDRQEDVAARFLQEGHWKGEVVQKRKDGISLNVMGSVDLIRDPTGEPVGAVAINRDITERKQAEEKLKKPERRLRSTLETMELAAVTLDTQGNITFCNDFLLRLTGWKRDEVLGKDWFEVFLPPEAREDIKQSVFLQTIRTGEYPTHYQNEILTKGGKRRLIAWNNTIFRNTQGEVIGVTSIGEDITRRKQAEDALRKSEEFLQTIFSHSDIGVFVVDVLGGGEYRYASINPVHEKLVRIKNEEVVGKTPRDLESHLGRESVDYVIDLYNECVERRETIESEAFVEIEGKGDWWLSRLTPLFDEEGRIYRLIGNGIIITERKQIEEKLREREERYRTLVEEINDVLYSVDKQGVVTYASPVVESVLGFSVSEVIGHPIAEFFFSEDLPHAEEKVQEVFSGDREPSEWRMKTKSGGFRWVRSSSQPIVEDGHVVGLRGVLTDITEHKQAEETLAQEYRWRDADSAIRLAVASVNEPQDLERVLAEVSRQLMQLGVPHEDCSLQIVTGDGTGFFTVGSHLSERADWSSIWDELHWIVQEGAVSFRHPPDEELPEGLLREKQTIIDVWKKGTFRYEPCTPEGLGFVPSGMSILDVAFSHGTMAINRKQSHAFGTEDIALLQRFAQIISEGFQRFLDITARQQAEEALRKNEEKLRNIVEYSTNLFYTHTSEHELTYISPQSREYLQCEPEEALVRWTEFTTDNPVNARGYALTEKAIETGERQPPYELELEGSKGRRIWVEVREAPIVENGQTVAIVGSLTDITEHKQAEEALRASEERYRSLLHHLPIGIVITTPDHLSYYNPRGLEMLGLESGDIDKLKPSDLYTDPKDREELMEHLDRDGFHEYEYWLKRKDGTPILVRGRSVAVFDDTGRPIRYEGYMEDITEYRKMGQELVRTQRLRVLSEMAAGFCHNFNNILTSVMGPAQLLKRYTDNPKALREAESIMDGATRARDLVQQLNRAVQEEHEGTLHPVSVNEVIQQAMETTRPRWKDESEAQGITIEVATELEEVASIGGTQSELNSILQNLLFNAVDAMPEGGTITFRTQALEEAVQLTVTDTGKGMDEETRRKVFDPFFTTKMDIGKGLGLTTVQGTITRWRGSIDVESTLGEGTTFTLRFPVWTEPEVEREEAAPESRQGRPGKLLIVEDDEGTCRLLERLLSETHEVETVLDGREALERFEPGQYDVVLIDLGMPGLAGDQVAQEMMRLDPAVVTVLITGWLLKPDDPRKSIFDFQIEKPFSDLDRVEDVVARAIALHDRRTEEGN